MISGRETPMTKDSQRSRRYACAMLGVAVCLTVSGLSLYPRWESFVVLVGAASSLLGAAVAAIRG
jgi:hypothetical protein